MEQKYDLIVIGSGPAGYVAAIRASQLGLKATVIEKEKLGGVCLNIGCIPSKTLIHQAETFRSIPELEQMGLKIDLENFDYSKVYEQSRKSADTLSQGVRFLLKKWNIPILVGTAKIIEKHKVHVASKESKHTIEAKNILIATGSRPKELPAFPFDENQILSSTGALMQKKLPKRILILGGGAIGVEFAHVMNAFGTEVHLVEALERILPLEDADITQILTRSFQKRGIKILTSTMALSMNRVQKEIEVTLKETQKKEEKTLTVNQVLVCVGRTPNSHDLGLEELGIPIQKGWIETGDYYQTRVKGIYAVGDVIDTPLLAHVASKEGEIAVEHMAGKSPIPRISEEAIPSATYCEPQVASFGYPEWKAKEKKLEYKTASFPYRGAGKSVAINRTEGLVKILYHPRTKEILSAHVVGAEATELLHEILLARSAELLPEDLATMIHAHPTLSESVMESMRKVEGWAIHS